MKFPDISRIKGYFPAAGAGLLFGLFLFYKSFSLHWYISDENIYYCMARDLGWSHWPYRDFFYANPPLLLFLLKLGGMASDWSVAGMRCVPVLCHLGAGLVLWRVLTPMLGCLVVVPLGVHLFSYDALRASTHSTGITESLLFIHLALYMALCRRASCAGVLLGLALWTKTYSVTAIPMIGAIFLLQKRKSKKESFVQAGKFAGVLVLMVLILVLGGFAFGGMKFWEMNVSYHLSKQPSDEGGSWEVFSQVAYRNQGSLYVLAICLAAGSLASLPVLRKHGIRVPPLDFLTGTPPLFHILLGLVHFFSVFVFLVMQGRIFDFYMLLFLPALALISAGCLMPVQKYFETWNPTKPGKWHPWIVESSFLVLIALILAHPFIPRSCRLFIPDLVTYLQHEARHADGLARWNPLLSVPGTTLFGDSGTAPLVALMSGAQLALGEADTNQMRFQGGFPAPGKFIQSLEESSVQWAVVRGRIQSQNRFIPRGLFAIPEFREYARTRFSSVDQVVLEGDTEIRLMHHNLP